MRPLLAAALLGALPTLAAAESRQQVQLCGGRSVSLPLLGSWEFWVTAVVDSGSGAFGFRIDRDLHQPWCSGSVADPSSGRLTRTAACLEGLLAKYRLTDVQLEAEGMPERVQLSAAAAPMGFSLGRMGLELTAEGCRPAGSGSSGGGDKEEL